VEFARPRIEHKEGRTIAAALPRDIDVLVEMGREFHASSEYAQVFKFNEDALRATMMSLIVSDFGDILVSTVDGTITGMIGLVVFAHPLCGDLTATELFWWVDPHHRGPSGVRLLRQAENWARERGATKLTMIAPNPRVELLYRKLGYGKVETSYALDLTKE
jgi:GNAT superfamily N-acetyltransferase